MFKSQQNNLKLKSFFLPPFLRVPSAWRATVEGWDNMLGIFPVLSGWMEYGFRRNNVKAIRKSCTKKEIANAF